MAEPLESAGCSVQEDGADDADTLAPARGSRAPRAGASLWATAGLWLALIALTAATVVVVKVGLAPAPRRALPHRGRVWER
ncbi:hypothetical protein KDL01_06845 [Actinospica durhamensis]|uniref:Uncharacterized protein n=1 Tax=Actinospica durhamensis TaxID=1508375 RepID=A0A941ELY1_9ACTN|nr:hypothetical protein [Actinospica durhamensis]MBR7832972.1 hypothetical protein [Actinospica durhamensis]